jgi:triacylglycerol lipase
VPVNRRRALAVLAAICLVATLLTSVAAQPPRAPILFVHGNGDSAAQWITTIWRFESNGYDRSLLHAIDFAPPSSRRDDGRPEDNRSSAADQTKALATAVEALRRATGSERVILVGSSRGGNAIRSYIKHGGGAATVSHAVLCGTPNHGVIALPEGLGSEFNGRGQFLTGLNTPDEVYPPVAFMTTRSDANDKYAQPDGRFVGRPGQATHVTYAGPELRGARNVILPGLDHREVAFHRLAFWAMWSFVTGGEPKTLDPAVEERPELDGLVSGVANRAPTNRPIAGASIEVYEVDPASGARLGGAVHRRTTGPDGRWGPFAAKNGAYYEFVLAAQGYPPTHIYRTPFPRGSRYVHLRLRQLGPRDTASVVTLSRPRGYLGHARDRFLIDGRVPEDVGGGVPGASEGTRTFTGPPRAVPVVLNDEALTVLTRPPGHVVLAEFHY